MKRHSMIRHTKTVEHRTNINELATHSAELDRAGSKIISDPGCTQVYRVSCSPAEQDKH